jgi:hypothetical protein
MSEVSTYSEPWRPSKLDAHTHVSKHWEQWELLNCLFGRGLLHYDDAALRHTVHTVFINANMPQLLKHGRFKIYYLIKLYLFLSRLHWLHLLKHWDRGFESHTRREYLCLFCLCCLVFRQRSFDRLIPRPRAIPTMRRIKKLKNRPWLRAINDDNLYLAYFLLRFPRPFRLRCLFTAHPNIIYHRLGRSTGIRLHNREFRCSQSSWWLFG